MIRTQVYIPDDIHRDLMLLVNQTGLNFSELIRQGAREVINKKKLAEPKRDWRKFIGAGGKTGVRTNAVKDIHDYYANWTK